MVYVTGSVIPMALLQDLEPPSKRGDKKTNILFQKTAKIKNYILNIFSKLAPAFFLLGSIRKTSVIQISEKKSEFSENLLPVYKFSKEHLPHLVVGVIAFVVITSNFVIRFAEANVNEYMVSDPGNEINLAAQANEYTPLLKNSAEAVEKAYAAPTDEFAQTTTTVDTVYTEREEPLPDNSASTVYYTVRNGDTLTTLGWKFQVKVATIKYANDMDTDLIKPGQQLKVPQAGYEVSANQIAAKQKEKLAAANRSTAYRTSSTSRSSYSVVSHSAGSRNNSYPYGYCTYYVATRRAVPSNMGNAKNWLYSASQNDMKTGSSPAVGAIVVTTESKWWGHVAYVEDVSDGYITISEMNYNGWGVTNRRTLPANGGVVRGYIY
jgi:surface antigen